MDSQSNSELLNSVLDSSVDSASSATNTAYAVRKDNYQALVALQNVTSFSMQAVLKECPRKFQLLKLSADCNAEEQRESNCDFAFGHAVGAGVATIDAGGGIREAIWAAFLAWNIDLLAEAPRKENRPAPKKSFHHACWALQVYMTFRGEETDLSDYDVVHNEATLAVDFEDGHYYVGHIDSVLKHRETGKLKIKENKTTGFATVDPALYANSDQALSYSLVVGASGESEYDVLYTIYSTTEQRWIAFEFTKTLKAKAEWLQGQLFVHSEIDLYSEHNFFPKNGASCLKWGRRCQYYETCDFNSKQVFGKRFDALNTIADLKELTALEKTDYAFTLSELTEAHRKQLDKE